MRLGVDVYTVEIANVEEFADGIDARCDSVK